MLAVGGAAGSLTQGGENLQVIDGGVTATPGAVFKLIGYTGTANGMFTVGGTLLADGATFMVGSNDYQISYLAGDPLWN